MIFALFEPDIPQNTGTILRLAACLDIAVHIIHPCGFAFSDKRISRSAMDYIHNVDLMHHDSWQDFTTFFSNPEQPYRFFLLTTKGSECFTKIEYRPHDVFIFGRESAGVTPEVEAFADKRILIPMKNNQRSLNVAISAAMVATEAGRQLKVFDT